MIFRRWSRAQRGAPKSTPTIFSDERCRTGTSLRWTAPVVRHPLSCSVGAGGERSATALVGLPTRRCRSPASALFNLFSARLRHFDMTRRQDSLDVAAHALASSKEASDAPLGPRNLFRKLRACYRALRPLTRTGLAPAGSLQLRDARSAYPPGRGDQPLTQRAGRLPRKASMPSAASGSSTLQAIASFVMA